MPEPPDRTPPGPEDDETRILPREDAWPADEEETVVRRERPALPYRPPGPVRERVRRPPPPPPPPPDRAVWPWLLLLLALVLGGIAAAWFFTREAEEDVRPVPAVVRLPEDSARDRLQAEGFQVQVEREPNEAPPGIVFAQAPDAGNTLPEGASVTIRVSEGLSTAAVPNVVGLPEAQAVERLEAAELSAEREEVFSEEPPGTVVAQAPAAGEEAELGSGVRIQVSAGSGRVEVPDLLGEHVDDARAALAELDLEANVVQVPSNEPEGTVVAQNPPGGAEATRGDSVRLNVSRGP